MSGALRFGEFAFDPASGELERRGRPVPLQPQPAKLLGLLAERAGELVTRQEIRRCLWGDALHVEVDQGINFCVCQLRRALRDDAARPRCIETLPRRGYRFVAPVEVVARRSLPRRRLPPARAAARHRPRTLAAAGLLLAATLVLGAGSRPAPLSSPPAAERARAHLELADAALHARHDWTSAAREFRTALELDPALVPARRGYAALLAARGDFDAALAEARRARELAPGCFAVNAELGWLLYLARRYDEAIEVSRAALALEPRDARTHLAIVHSYLEKGEPASALAAANAHLRALFGDGDAAPRVATLRAYWRGAVEYRQARGDGLPPAELALLRLSLGEASAGLSLLEQSCRDHDGRDLLFAAVDPRLDPWRRDPRLARVLACVGLEPSRAG